MSKLAKKLGLALGLEDDAPAAEININVETDDDGNPVSDFTNDGEPTGAQDQVEVAEAEAEVAESNDQVEELEEAQETLENYYVALESYERNGGVSREAATFMAVGVDSVTRRFGIGLEDLNISVESFGENKARATTVSMEGIKDMLVQLWNKIKETMFKMWKALKNFFMKIFSGANRTKRRAESIKKKAEQQKGAIAEKTIEVGVLKQLNLDGKAPSPKELEDGLLKIRTITNNLTKSGFDATEKESIKLIQDLSTVSGKDSKLYTAIAEWRKEYDKAAAEVLAGPSKATEKQAKHFVRDITDAQLGYAKNSGQLLGNRTIVAVALPTPQVSNTTIDDVRKAIGGAGVGMFDYSDRTREVESTGTFQTLSAGDVIAACNGVVDICDNIISYQKVWDERNGSLNKIISAGDKAVKSVESDKDADDYNKKIAEIVIRDVTSRYRGVVNLESQVIRYALTTSSAALNLCVSSLRAHKAA